MIALAARTFIDRWQLFVGTMLAVTAGVAIVHAGMSIVLAVGDAHAPAGATPAEADSFQQSVSGASTLTGMTVMLGAFLTIFVVGSTFGFAVDQRRSDLAILRLGGVTARQIRRLLLAEAALAAAGGTVAGAVLGVGLTYVQRAILTSMDIFPDGVSTPVRLPVFIIDLCVAAAVSLLGAWGAARRATAIGPLSALRRSGDEQRIMTVRRWATALFALGLTVVQIYFSTTLGGVLIPLLLGLGIVITGSVAMSQLSPILVPAAAGVLRPWVERSPVVGLAVAGLRDAVRRTASCAAPMIVLVSLVAGLQGILDTQTQAGAVETTRLLRADLVARGDKIDVAAMRNLDDVTVAAPETVVPLGVRINNGTVTQAGLGTVVAVDPDGFRATHLQRPSSGDLANFGGNRIVLGPGLDSTSVSQSDSITVTIDERTVKLTRAARMETTIAGGDGFYLDRALVPPDLLAAPTTVLLQVRPGTDTATLTAQLRAAGATSVQTLAQYADSAGSQKNDENRGVMVAIVGLGSLYALISVLSTLAIATGQRRGEFATLRLSGLTRRQLNRTVVLEALASTTIGLVLGAVVAVAALVGLWVATNRVYGVPVIAIPWELFGAITLVTLTLTAVTALLATRGAVKAPAIRALGTRE